MSFTFDGENFGDDAPPPVRKPAVDMSRFALNNPDVIAKTTAIGINFTASAPLISDMVAAIQSSGDYVRLLIKDGTVVMTAFASNRRGDAVIGDSSCVKVDNVGSSVHVRCKPFCDSIKYVTSKGGKTIRIMEQNSKLVIRSGRSVDRLSTITCDDASPLSCMAWVTYGMRYEVPSKETMSEFKSMVGDGINLSISDKSLSIESSTEGVNRDASIDIEPIEGSVDISVAFKKSNLSGMSNMKGDTLLLQVHENQVTVQCNYGQPSNYVRLATTTKDVR